MRSDIEQETFEAIADLAKRQTKQYARIRIRALTIGIIVTLIPFLYLLLGNLGYYNVPNNVDSLFTAVIGIWGVGLGFYFGSSGKPKVDTELQELIEKISLAEELTLHQNERAQIDLLMELKALRKSLNGAKS